MRFCSALLLLAASAFGQGQLATVGQVVPDVDFGEFLLGGDGRTSLEEFRGQVVLLDFWGTR